MTSSLHQNELTLDAGLVSELIGKHVPGLAHLGITPLRSRGSSNFNYHLGNDLLIRLPRLHGGGQSITKEYRWGQWVGAHLSLDTPEFIEIFPASEAFPESWAILRWMPGMQPEITPHTSVRSDRLVQGLTELLRTLRTIDIPPEASADAQLHEMYRGHTLFSFDEAMRRHLAECRGLKDLELDLDLALEIWQHAVTEEQKSDQNKPQRWFHGDIVAENLLMQDAKLSGLLDFGGLGIGDPAIDLHGTWELFNASERAQLKDALSIGDLEWTRARAWALAVALMTLPYYWSTLPERIASRLRIAQAVIDEWR